MAEKWKALKDLENRILNKDVTAKYGFSRNTISTSVKSKHKLTASLEKMELTPWEKVTLWEHERIDKTIYNCVYRIRNQEMPKGVS